MRKRINMTFNKSKLKLVKHQIDKYELLYRAMVLKQSGDIISSNKLLAIYNNSLKKELSGVISIPKLSVTFADLAPTRKSTKFKSFFTDFDILLTNLASDSD